MKRIIVAFIVLMIASDASYAVDEDVYLRNLRNWRDIINEYMNEISQSYLAMDVDIIVDRCVNTEGIFEKELYRAALMTPPAGKSEFHRVFVNLFKMFVDAVRLCAGGDLISAQIKFKEISDYEEKITRQLTGIFKTI